MLFWKGVQESLVCGLGLKVCESAQGKEVPGEKRRVKQVAKEPPLPLQKELGSHPGAFLAAASHAEIRCEMHCSLLAMILQVLIDFLCRVIFH